MRFVVLATTRNGIRQLFEPLSQGLDETNISERCFIKGSTLNMNVASSISLSRRMARLRVRIHPTSQCTARSLGSCPVVCSKVVARRPTFAFSRDLSSVARNDNSRLSSIGMASFRVRITVDWTVGHHSQKIRYQNSKPWGFHLNFGESARFGEILASKEVKHATTHSSRSPSEIEFSMLGTCVLQLIYLIHSRQMIFLLS
jgi:hypothetical protein